MPSKLPVTLDQIESSVKDILNEHELDTSDSTSYLNTVINQLLKKIQAETIGYKVVISGSLVGKEIKDDVKQSIGFLWNDSTDGIQTIKLKATEAYEIILNILYIKS